MNPSTSENPSHDLGAYLKEARTSLGMSLRDVEVATDKQISNAYLSQLENGKISKPSPHILYTLSGIYHVGYEKIMERAGYLHAAPATGARAAGAGKTPKHGRLATNAIEHLTPEEERALRNYLEFWRRDNPREKA